MNNDFPLFEKPITILQLDTSMNEILFQNNIYLIKDLWLLDKTNLRQFGLDTKQIKQISIKLQLIGIDLNKKLYQL